MLSMSLTSTSSSHLSCPSHFSLSSPPLSPSSLSHFKSICRNGFSFLPLRCLPGPTNDTQEAKEEEKARILIDSGFDISTYSWCAGLSGLGFLETAYLTFLKVTNSEAFCPVGGGSCSDVLNSDYAFVFGVPLPLIGFTTYGFVLFLGLKLAGWNIPIKINRNDGRLLLLSVTSAMAASSAYFLYILSTRFAGTSCSYCLASAILSFSLFFIILKDFELQEIQKVAAIPLCTAGIIFTVLSTTYNSIPPTSPRLTEVNLPYYKTEITTESSPFAISLANHLRSIGAKMYGAFWCTHCQEQKEMFGSEAAKLLDYVECYPDGYKTGVLMAPECFITGIEGFPTWVINGEVVSGIKELEELARVSGFDVNLQN